MAKRVSKLVSPSLAHLVHTKVCVEGGGGGRGEKGAERHRGGGGDWFEHQPTTDIIIILLNEIQSRHSSTGMCLALHSHRPADTGLQNGARCKLE